MGVLQDIEYKLADFKGRGGELLAMSRELAMLKRKAEADSDTYRLREIAQAREAVMETYSEWVDTMQKLRGVIGLVNKMPGVEWEPLGAVPFVIVGATAAAATAALVAMTLVVNKTIRMRMTLDGIEEGWLTVEEAVAVQEAASTGLGSFFGGVGAGTLLAIGAALFLLPQLTGRR